MTNSLLVTKLFIPVTKPELVNRQNLIERLDEGLERKLTLISAPAGFGKTTLVSEWVQAIDKSTPPTAVAWLSLDSGDNDLTRFLIYFIATLKQSEGVEATLGKRSLSMLQSPQSPPTEAVLTPLINEIANIPSKMILVLDDYHLIDAQPIHEALSFFLENLPPQMHIVIATREDPHLPLARLRARGQLSELRANDLRFTSTEAAEFLNRVMGLDLTIDDIGALEERTEGWIVGLQLAAISMQSTRDAKGFIRSFAGSNRYILDYLIEEVLEQQPESVQAFMLETAILERLNGGLCDAVTGQKNGHETLEMLDRTNLFVIPLDDGRQWYRYHHLFADLLRQRLKQIRPERISALHQLASEWYEQSKFIDQAINHAIKCENFERAAALMDRQADEIWRRGELYKLFRWLDKLPDAILLSKPKLCIYDAWHQFISGKQDAAEEMLQAAEHAVAQSIEVENKKNTNDHASNTIPVSSILGRTATIRAELAFFRGDLRSIKEYAQLALDQLPLEDMSFRSAATAALGDAYSLGGDLENAYKARLNALEMGKTSKNHYLRLIAIMKLSVTLRQQGRLQEIGELFDQELQIAEENGMSFTDVFGCIYVIWGEVLAEYNDLDEAIDLARQGVELTERGRDLGLIGWAYSCMMRILFSKQDYGGGEEIYQKAEKINQELGLPPWAMDRLDAWKPRIWLAQGNLEDASLWVQERRKSIDGEISYQNEPENIIFARVLIAQNNLDDAILILQRLFESASAGERIPKIIEILALQAITYHMADFTELAISKLIHALDLAQPRGFLRVFVDEGQPMAGLLYEALQREISPEYVQRLLAAFPVIDAERTPSERTQVDQSELIEPLSERELEVLQFLADGLTNKEIATRLYLSQHTVKVHARNIYSKLGVSNRAQAGAKARALGLLSPH